MNPNCLIRREMAKKKFRRQTAVQPPVFQFSEQAHSIQRILKKNQIIFIKNASKWPENVKFRRKMAVFGGSGGSIPVFFQFQEQIYLILRIQKKNQVAIFKIAPDMAPPNIFTFKTSCFPPPLYQNMYVLLNFEFIPPWYLIKIFG